VKASVMTVAVNIQGLLHGFASDEVMKHVLGSYAFEQFEAASYRPW
jgi:ferritin-like metal-binding protein YciE